MTCPDLANVKEVSVWIDGEERMADVVQAFQPFMPDVKLTYVAGRMPTTGRPADDHLWVTFRNIDDPRLRVPWSCPRRRGVRWRRRSSVRAGRGRSRCGSMKSRGRRTSRVFAAGDRARHWVVGQSARPCATPDEAEREACADAARQLTSLLQGHFPVCADVTPSASVPRPRWPAGGSSPIGSPAVSAATTATSGTTPSWWTPPPRPVPGRRDGGLLCVRRCGFISVARRLRRGDGRGDLHPLRGGQHVHPRLLCLAAARCDGAVPGRRAGALLLLAAVG